MIVGCVKALRFQKFKESSLFLFTDIHAANHDEPAERRHIRNDVIDVREVPALGADRIQIALKPCGIRALTLKRADTAGSFLSINRNSLFISPHKNFMDDETGKDQSNIGNHSDTEEHERRRQPKRRIAPVASAPSFYEGI